jgi:hypothetical protein
LAVVHTPGDLCLEGLRDLYGERAYAAGCADDQHVLPWLGAAGVAKALHGGESGDGDDRGLLEGEIRRLGHERVLTGAGVLSEGTLADSEALVADHEPGHVCAVCTTMLATSSPGTRFFGLRRPKYRQPR